MGQLRKGRKGLSEKYKGPENILGNYKWDCNRKNSINGLSNNLDTGKNRSVNIESRNLKECRARKKKKRGRKYKIVEKDPRGPVSVQLGKTRESRERK